MVSYYFHTTKRMQVYNETISEFIRDDKYGARSCVEFYRIWWLRRSVPKEFLLVRYEDMKAEPQQSLRSVLDFIGVPRVDSSMLDDAVEYASFENMKKMEATHEFRRSMLTPGDTRDAESFKVRRGKVGGYRDYLSAGDCAYLDRVIAEACCPLLEPYKTRECAA
jgi:hypothetical protein